MKTIRLSLIVLAFFSSNATLRADDKDGEFAELAQALLSGIQSEDVVEYTSCWLSFRASRAAAPKDAGEFAKDKIDRTREYIRNRNKKISKSFDVIQAAIRQLKIDRKSIALVAVAAEVYESEGIKRTHDFTFTFTTNVGELKLEIDDGALVDGLWYFTDSPTALHFGGHRQRFKVDEP